MTLTFHPVPKPHPNARIRVSQRVKVQTHARLRPELEEEAISARLVAEHNKTIRHRNASAQFRSQGEV